jgi:ankyrin repeat protein
MWATHKGNVRAAVMLLNSSADVSVKDEYGKSAPTYAAHMGNTEIVELFKERMERSDKES